MEKVFASPSRYIQGPNVLTTGVEHIKALGTHALLLCDDTVYKIAGEALVHNLEQIDVQVEYVPFNGEASMEEIERVSRIGQDKACEVVMGLGGGKAIDAAKAIGDKIDAAVAILPTIASTDAPTSALSVVYTPQGVFEKYLFYNKNPELVLIDTAIIAKAPARLLASGIADAMATWVEGRAIIESHGNTMAGGKPTLAAQAIARQCEQTLFENSLKAIAACHAGVPTEALEAIVEANTLLSGLGFESCGLAAAHAIHNGFTALDGPIHSLTHGEKVAYGTLTQLILENAPKEELDRYIELYQSLNLPTTLAEMKLEDVSYEDLLKVGELATQEGETIHEMGRDYTKEDVANALLVLDHYVVHEFRK